ncbi:MAG TPA: hypothetical protein VGF22_12020 [Acidimicrobiales bacterium]
MKAVVLGPRPAELEELIRRRRKLGVDTFDEVWEGSYHLAPAAHPAHGYIDNELAALLAPVARSVGLVGRVLSTSATRTTAGCPTVAITEACQRRRGWPPPPS